MLGEQAVTDPSKVEMRVLQQMQQRVLNHEMRNLAAQLTPAERAAKRMKKLQEDTSRIVHVAVFKVNALTNPKHRFKVDVNAQQYYLSGTVLLNQEVTAESTIIPNSSNELLPIIDDRVVITSRDRKGKKGLSFMERG